MPSMNASTRGVDWGFFLSWFFANFRRQRGSGHETDQQYSGSSEMCEEALTAEGAEDAEKRTPRSQRPQWLRKCAIQNTCSVHEP